MECGQGVIAIIMISADSTEMCRWCLGGKEDKHLGLNRGTLLSFHDSTDEIKST